MEPIHVKKIRTLLEGELFCGTENWYVKDAIVYKRHKLEHPHTLIFLFKRESIYWGHLERLAPCVVITDKSEDELRKVRKNTTIIRVKSTLQAYWKFVNYYRNLFDIPVVAITGTCGKTTTKEMIKHILSKSYNVQASVSSINEPRRSFPYLMGINRQTEMAVFETGLGNIGNIKHQCLIYQPTIGIITTIDAHHLDGCKTLEGYVQAKGEIVDGVKENGTLILNRDDDNIKKISLAAFRGDVIYFGAKTRSDYKADHIRFAKDGMDFDLIYKNTSYPVFVPGYGEHQVYNALAAIAAVHVMGIEIQEAAQQLASFENMVRHLEVGMGINGCTIIDDTWTINPLSVEAALKVVDEIGKGKKTILLLGDINRLGNYEKEYHQKVGSIVAKKRYDTLITIGEKAVEIGKQALKDHFQGQVYMFPTVDGVKEILENLLDDQSLLLIKGPMKSRSMIDLASSLKLNKPLDER
ncbi:MAG TPA: UDP-N-acetylmuramoyl-tripeptide--D-alanyl-D-alanine ligase [Bacillales bacterium]|nr:UDP-N-acetylmuramoyl-tripeptide--D-alanyl-D-alanine ligase [Bacillales bacterium]